MAGLIDFPRPPSSPPLPSRWAHEEHPVFLWHWTAPQTGRGTARGQLCHTTQSSIHWPVSSWLTQLS